MKTVRDSLSDVADRVRAFDTEKGGAQHIDLSGQNILDLEELIIGLETQLATWRSKGAEAEQVVRDGESDRRDAKRLSWLNAVQRFARWNDEDEVWEISDGMKVHRCETLSLHDAIDAAMKASGYTV